MTTEDAFLQDILQDPSDTGPQRIYADWLQDQGREQEAQDVRAGSLAVRVGSLEWLAAQSLSRCRYGLGTAEKRFAQILFFLSAGLGNGFSLTVQQWAYLWRLVWRYRGQLQPGGRMARRTNPLVVRAALLLRKAISLHGPDFPEAAS